jgi:hypothetical protein
MRNIHEAMLNGSRSGFVRAAPKQMSEPLSSLGQKRSDPTECVPPNSAKSCKASSSKPISPGSRSPGGLQPETGMALIRHTVTPDVEWPDLS